MSAITTTFTPAPGLAVTFSIITDEDKITTRIFTFTGKETHTDTFSHPIDKNVPHWEGSESEEYFEEYELSEVSQ